MTHPPRRNSQAELDAFVAVCERLGGFDRWTTPEWADGYLTAMAVGARAVALDECLVKMARDDAWERAFADPEDRLQAERALRARIAVLNDQLDAEALIDEPDRLRLSPFMIEWTDEDRAAAVDSGSADNADELVTGAEWADGFAAAVRDFGDRWPQASADQQEIATELARQVTALGLAEGSEALREHVAASYGDEGADRDRLIDSACFAVQDLRVWVVDNAPRPETRQVEKPPGRNDPCPCGSGKKFKKCHGGMGSPPKRLRRLPPATVFAVKG